MIRVGINPNHGIKDIVKRCRDKVEFYSVGFVVNSVISHIDEKLAKGLLCMKKHHQLIKWIVISIFIKSKLNLN